MKNNFLKIGHRGVRGEAPENTISAFQRAIAHGVNAIELDVRQTKDYELIVFHDANFKKLTGVNAQVSTLTLSQIKKLKVGGEEIPTLDEALTFIDKKVKKILIEIKEVGTEKKVLNVVKKHKLKEAVVVASFHERALQNVRKVDKTIETGLIYVIHQNPIKAAKSLQANYLVSMYRFTQTKNIEKAHSEGLKIIVWTVNDRQEIKKYIEKGVDGVATDKPELFKT